MRKLPDRVGEMDADIRAYLEAAGLIVARDRFGDLVSIERETRCVWYDVGWTTRLVGDVATDRGDVLFAEVATLLRDFGVMGGPPVKAYRRVERHRRRKP